MYWITLILKRFNDEHFYKEILHRALLKVTFLYFVHNCCAKILSTKVIQPIITFRM